MHFDDLENQLGFLNWKIDTLYMAILNKDNSINEKKEKKRKVNRILYPCLSSSLSLSAINCSYSWNIPDLSLLSLHFIHFEYQRKIWYAWGGDRLCFFNSLPLYILIWQSQKQTKLQIWFQILSWYHLFLFITVSWEDKHSLYYIKKKCNKKTSIQKRLFTTKSHDRKSLCVITCNTASSKDIKEFRYSLTELCFLNVWFYQLRHTLHLSLRAPLYLEWLPSS